MLAYFLWAGLLTAIATEAKNIFFCLNFLCRITKILKSIRRHIRVPVKTLQQNTNTNAMQGNLANLAASRTTETSIVNEQYCDSTR